MNEQNYTHKPIKGITPKITLPEGTSLILEGGGTRGFYSAGVFEAFMDQGIMFPYIIGVSAGAANAISYVSGQQKRNRQVVEYYVGSKRYVSKRNLLLHGSMFNMDFVFHTVPGEHIAVDWDNYNKQNVRFLTGAMDCGSGKTVWFEKEDITPSFDATIASCSIPVVSRIASYKGFKLLDGGVSDPIPIEKSIEDGNNFHVIILTQNEGYRKTPFKQKGILKLFYRNYPEVTEAVLKRHETYNRQIEICEQLEREGKAIIIRPEKPLKVDRTGSDIPALLDLYDEGHEEGKNKLPLIMEKLNY